MPSNDWDRVVGSTRSRTTRLAMAEESDEEYRECQKSSAVFHNSFQGGDRIRLRRNSDLYSNIWMLA